MVRTQRSVIWCDGEDGCCGDWEIDYYAETCSTVGGVRITNDAPAPGWVSTSEGDFCPTHVHLATPADGEAGQ